MGMYLNPGNRMFQEVLNGKFYVDKTGLATFMNERLNTPEKYVCVSRPRRFGKSVDADMLVAYYSRGADSRAQFEGLDVSRSAGFEGHLNAHNVIKLDMTQVLPLADGPGGIAATIERKVCPELEREWPEVLEAGYDSLPEALALVEAAMGTGFVFVVDEWDCVMREAAHDEAAQRAYLEFLRDLLKGRSYVDAAYMTGILPIKKYGVHSALNMFTEYSATSPKDLTSYVGFRAAEVKALCERFGMDYAPMAHWYDGYLVGPDREHMYNPRSVSGAISSGEFDSFWVDTETYEALQVYIDMDFDGVQQDLVAMMDGARVATDVRGFQNDMTTFASKDDVYALLVHLGYLGYDQVERAVFIPNEEIRREFATSLRTSKARPQLARLVRESRELLAQTLEGNEEYVADALDRAHSAAASPLHYNSEQALRAAVKLAYIWAIDDYLRVEELPGGKGFADLVYVPKPGSALPPMVVELKWDKPAEAAIDQIRERRYPDALAGLGGVGGSGGVGGLGGSGGVGGSGGLGGLGGSGGFGGECLLVGVTYEADGKGHSCKIERITLPG